MKHIWLWTALFSTILLWGTACKEQGGDLLQNRTTVQAGLDEPEAQPRKATVSVRCTVGSMEIVEMSQSRFLTEEKAQQILQERVNRHFPPDDGPGTLTLYVQYAIRRGDEEPDRFFFGAKGFLKGPGTPLPVVLEADGQKDGPVPEACKEALNSPLCAGQIADTMAQPAFELLVRRLSRVCALHGADEKTVSSLFGDSDPWVRGQAGMQAGEAGLASLVPALEKLASDEAPEAALPAIGALGRLKAQDSVHVLVNRARQADEVITHAVAVALAEIGSDEARRYLETWAVSHPIASIKTLAGELLSE